LIPTRSPFGVSRVASGLLCVHAIAITPADSMELVRSSISIVSGLPCVTVRSAPAITFSGPAQRSLTLWPTRSPSHLVTLSIESSDSFVAFAAASIATGWNEPVPGRELHPLKSSAFHGALLRQSKARSACISRCRTCQTIAEMFSVADVNGHYKMCVAIEHDVQVALLEPTTRNGYDSVRIQLRLAMIRFSEHHLNLFWSLREKLLALDNILRHGATQ